MLNPVDTVTGSYGSPDMYGYGYARQMGYSDNIVAFRELREATHNFNRNPREWSTGWLEMAVEIVQRFHREGHSDPQAYKWSEFAREVIRQNRMRELPNLPYLKNKAYDQENAVVNKKPVDRRAQALRKMWLAKRRAQ